MSIGTRIAELRKQHRVSQEYLAEKLGVSRQAVSKWEQDLTHPDTGNLIKLAELFHVSVEYLATGKTEDPVPTERPAKHRFKWKKKHVAGIIVSAALCLVIAGIIRIATLPVDWDAGACAGGYATHIFNLYGDELVQNYLNASSKKDDILSISAGPGTQEAEWEGRTIFLHFDIQYEDRFEGTTTEHLTFIGNRYWFDTFKWRGAIIAG